MNEKGNQGIPMIAIGYVRVSTDKQEDSPAAQEAAIRTWCAKQEMEVVEVVTEQVSSKQPLSHRLGLLDAIDALKENGATRLVAVARDRFARDTIELAMIERLVTSKGAQLATTDGVSLVAGPEGLLIRKIVDAVSEYERAQIGARTRRVMQQKRSNLEKTGGIAPYGWKFKGDRIVEDPTESGSVDRIVALKAEGASLQGICDELTAEGYTPRGKKWHVNTVRRVLKARKSPT